MARSPVKDDKRNRTFTASPARSLSSPRNRKRAKKWERRYKNFRLLRLFRLGRRQRLWRRPRRMPPCVDTLREERNKLMQENQALFQALQSNQAKSMGILKDNIKVKEDNRNLRSVLQNAYVHDIERYEAVNELEYLKQVVARLLVQSEMDRTQAAEAHDDLIRLIPNYHEIAVTECLPRPLSLHVRMATAEKKYVSRPPNLSPTEEEYQVRRDAPMVRAARLTSKAPKRRTALPSELIQGISGLSDISSSSAGTPSPQRTEVPETRPSPRLAVESAEEPSVSPPTPTEEPKSFEYPEPKNTAKNKRSLTTAAFEPSNPRRSIGVSPRPVGSSRRSLHFNSTREEFPIRPKKLCFNRDAEEEETSPVEETPEDEEAGETSVMDLITPVQNLTLSEEFTSMENFAFSESQVERSLLSDSSFDFEAGGDSEGGRTRARIGRASKNRISSMKEPSLNTKMRRPVDVPPLHPSSDKKKGKKSGNKESLPRSSKKSAEVEPVSG